MVFGTKHEGLRWCKVTGDAYGEWSRKHTVDMVDTVDTASSVVSYPKSNTWYYLSSEPIVVVHCLSSPEASIRGQLGIHETS
jgi:hypothetical protein